jgi:hypothetical protein
VWDVLRDGVPGEVDAGDRERLARFAAFADGERAALPRRRLDELLERAIAASGYDVAVLELAGGARRLANVDKLLRMARGFEAAEGRDLRAFVDHAAALEQAQKREPEAAVEDPDLDAVRLMTIHAAKGLEFGVVAVADLGRRPNTSGPLLQTDGERVGLRLTLLDGVRGTAALDYDALNAERLEREAAEEERILYVALTRAKRRLLLSGGAPRFAPPGAAPLNWLGPALVPDLEQRFAAALGGGEEGAPPPEPVQTVSRPGFDVRVTLSTPATFGRALRREAAAPGGSAPAAASGTPSAAPSAVPGETPSGAAAPAPPAPVSALSYTALAAYRRCGYRFYVQRVAGLPDRPAPPGAAPAGAPGGGGLAARARGVVVHALLEELDLGAPGRPPDPERVHALARREGARASEADVEHVARLVAALSASEPGRRLAGARRLRREHEFAVTLDGELLVGVIDALAVEPDGGWLVVDFKTDRLADPQTDVEALVALDYAIQRDLYALAALRAGAPRVEVVHLFLERPDDPASATFTAADEPALAGRVRALTDPLARGEFPLTPHPHAALCATCPARGGPCPYPEELTLRPDGHGPPAFT